MIILSECNKHDKCQIVGFSDKLEKRDYLRLLELGLTVGQAIKVDYFSMLKKVMLIEVRGYCLSLRCNMAKYIMVEKCKN